MKFYILILWIIFSFPYISLSQWIQLGEDFTTTSSLRLGDTHFISLDSIGNTLAISAPFDPLNEDFFGFAEVYDWDGSEWIQRGNTFYGDSLNHKTGAAVALSADGLTFALGRSFAYNSLGYRSGTVTVYDWIDNEWILRGNPIEGEGSPDFDFDNDNFGSAISMSPDGNYLAIGAKVNTNKLSEPKSGHVRVYNWNGTSWEQIGQDIDGKTELEKFGYSVSINETGTIVAIGANEYSNIIKQGGYVKVYELTNGDWLQKGTTISGTGWEDKLGNSVSLNLSGNTMAVGAPNSEDYMGSTKIYGWNGSDWSQKGQTLIGNYNARSGTSVDLSDDGNILAIGEPHIPDLENQVKTYKWDGTTWKKFGASIDTNEDFYSAFGSSVVLNSSGNRVAIGGPRFDGTSGHVRVYSNINAPVNNKEINAINVRVFPNPVNNQLYITSESLIQEINIINYLGQKVLNISNVNSKDFEINTQDLFSGNYILQVQFTDTTEILKFIKL